MDIASPSSRRDFIKLTLTCSGVAALYFPINLPAAVDASAPPITNYVTGLIQISKDGAISLLLNQHEMGQGVIDGLVTLIAEELNTPPGMILVNPVNIGPDQDNPLYRPRNTGGSSSLRTNWHHARVAAAYLREALEMAAQLRQQSTANSSPGACILKDGIIVTDDGAISLEAVLPWLSEAQKRVSIDRSTPKLPPYRFIGNDSESKKRQAAVSSGAMQYCYDLPCDCVVAIKRPPATNARVLKLVTERTLAARGVIDIIEVNSAIGVVAKSTWHALQGKDLLDVEWEFTSVDSHETYYSELDQSLTNSSRVVSQEGDKGTHPPSFTKRYQFPFLAHATMEPLCCIVDCSPESCTIWAGTQKPDWVIQAASRITGIPKARIQLLDIPSGGSFGRRLTNEFILEAITIGLHLQKRVKVVWDREETFKSGYLRPPACVEIEGFEKEGELIGITHKVASPEDLTYWFPPSLDSNLSNQLKSYTGEKLRYVKRLFNADNEISMGGPATGGAIYTPYKWSYHQVEHAKSSPNISVGFWRSVGHAFNVFALECFIDEWCYRQNRDPIDFRLALLPQSHPQQQLLSRLQDKIRANQSNNKQPPVGIAIFSGYGSHIALAAELNPKNTTTPQVRRIMAIVDCGTVVTPDRALAQIEGGILMGISASLHEEVSIQQGKIAIENFHHYPILRIHESPTLDIELISSSRDPGGVGELGVPATAPAIANAWRALTGKHITTQPLTKTEAMTRHYGN